MEAWDKAFLSWHGGPLPDDYLTIDCETTGFKKDYDLPLDIGHCLVRGRQIVNRGHFVLNWFGYPGIEAAWLEARIRRVNEAMRNGGHDFVYSADYVREHGQEPARVLEFYRRLLQTNQDYGAAVVGHAICSFDSELISVVMQAALGTTFRFPVDNIYDTGAMYKAIHGQLTPRQDDRTLWEYFRRVIAVRKAGLKWGLDHCVESYGFYERFGLSAADFHQAEFDAYCAHLLFEEHRKACA